MADAVDELGQILRERGLTVAVAESLTGGGVSEVLTRPPGASDYFVGSVVAYATRLKAELLAVDEALLAEEGPVHPDVAAQLADGVRQLCQADIGLSTTGIAGPSEQNGTPVGTVFVAVSLAEQGIVVAQPEVSGDRDSIRQQSIEAVIELALAVLRQNPPA